MVAYAYAAQYPTEVDSHCIDGCLFYREWVTEKRMADA